MTGIGRLILFLLENWPRWFSWIARRYMKRKITQAVAAMPRVTRQQTRIIRQAALGRLQYHDLESRANIEVFKRMAEAS